MDSEDAVQRLRERIARTKRRLKILESRLEKTEEQQQQRVRSNPQDGHGHSEKRKTARSEPRENDWQCRTDSYDSKPLQAEEYKRYGRQMILPQIGLDGQLILKDARVLIVGLGGLGCPAAAYLAAAGVGTIGLIDGDVVETSNLHRQIIHTTSTIGMYKVDSAAQYLRQLNPLPTYNTYAKLLQPQDAVDLFEQYDLVLDCTDHPTSRYLISDAAVLALTPLVSASALGMEGQLLVLNDIVNDDAAPGAYCYRCVFPKPPPPETILSCGEGGIFGPVVGIMGILMAITALKLLIRDLSCMVAPPSEPPFDMSSHQPSMLLYSAISEPAFRTIRLRGSRDDCPSCGDDKTITKESLTSRSLDYAAFCGTQESMNPLEASQRKTPRDFIRYRKTQPKAACVLIDVRKETEFALGHIEGSIHVPMEVFTEPRSSDDPKYSKKSNEPPARYVPKYPRHDDNPILKNIFPWSRIEYDLDDRNHDLNEPEQISIFTICRHSNDSQLAVRCLQRRYPDCKFIGDIKGGLEIWRDEIDPTFPDY